MGCDIHCYIEHRASENDYWVSFGSRINPGRHYGIFGALAGVRSDGCLIEARGMPADAAFASRWDNVLCVTDDEPGDKSVSLADAERWVASGASRYTNDSKRWVTNSDAHTHSWLTADEFEAAMPSNAPAEYRAVIAAMRSLESSGRVVRIVFWFDN